jgi:hypothetical protein
MLSLAHKEEEVAPRTRCGYLPSESVRSFEKALRETGAIATGRALHFAADVVASGGFDSFLRALWEYAICHIGLASPRIFVYLKKRLEEIADMMKRLPDEQAYSLEEFQIRIGELVLVLREAPPRTVVAWPKVGTETHAEGWIRAVAAAPETAVVRRVWRPEGDASILRTVGSEICKAIGDGSTEKALFWVKWLFEEEGKIKKEAKGSTLTTQDRGPAGSKQKSGVGFFILALYAETYKELAAKQVVRMHEEFQTLLDLWRTGDKRVQGGAKKQILTVLTQILCEVPRWKVPAAPALIKDPVAMSLAIRQVPKFFREVLAYDPPQGLTAVTKAFKTRGKVDAKVVAKAKKGEAAEAKMDAFDKALEEYFARQ